jgi:hypothetical protein
VWFSVIVFRGINELGGFGKLTVFGFSNPQK